MIFLIEIENICEYKMKLRKLYCFVIIILIFLKILFNFTISTESKKSNNNYKNLVNKVLSDNSIDLWDGQDRSNNVIPFHIGLKFKKKVGK